MAGKEKALVNYRTEGCGEVMAPKGTTIDAAVTASRLVPMSDSLSKDKAFNGVQVEKK